MSKKEKSTARATLHLTVSFDGQISLSDVLDAAREICEKAREHARIEDGSHLEIHSAERIDAGELK